MSRPATRNCPSRIQPHVLTTEVDKISHWAKYQSLSPYDKFNHNAFYAGNDDGDDDVIADEDEVLVMDDDESAERLHAGAAVIHESYSSPAITKIMECIKARDRAASP